MAENGQRDIDTSVSQGPVHSSPSPAAGALSSMTLASLTGEAAMNGQLDPMSQGRILLQEGDPRIEMVRAQVEQTRALSFKVGAKVYHKRRKKEYKVLEVVSNDEVVIVGASGKKRRANISDLVKL